VLDLARDCTYPDAVGKRWEERQVGKEEPSPIRTGWRLLQIHKAHDVGFETINDKIDIQIVKNISISVACNQTVTLFDKVIVSCEGFGELELCHLVFCNILGGQRDREILPRDNIDGFRLPVGNNHSLVGGGCPISI